MIVILEGGDGSGKSTLCKQLKELIKLKETSVKKDDTAAYGTYITLAVDEDTYILDRSFITDIVYRLFDNGIPCTMDLKMIGHVLSTERVVVVYCENETSFEDGMKRGEDNITNKDDAEEIKAIYRLIVRLIEKYSKVPVYRYDWHNDNANNVAEYIQKILKGENK